MSQYIDKATVKAHIATLQADILGVKRNSRSRYDEGRFDALSAIETIIDSLETREIEESASATEPSDFGEFWQAYDKKVGRRKAEALWARLSKRDRAAALSYIPAYKTAQPDKRYRKNPDAFLRNRSWEDEIIYQSPPTHYASLSYPTAAMAENRKNEVRELSRIATAGAAALAGLVGGSENE